MAKLYFYYSAMNAGKSTVLLQSAHNYRERGMQVTILTSELDDREAKGWVSSRIGLKSPADTYNRKTDIFQYVCNKLQTERLSCVLVDEAQFLTYSQVKDIARVADQLDIPVLAYGLRTDFKGNLFQGSQYLLAWAEELIEIKTICRCGRKATMNARMNHSGHMVIVGDQVQIGGNDRYESMCRKCFMTKASEVESIQMELVDA
ncbi:MAG: thymidine kinase [Pseudomonadota bacterium]|nr:thymidine kinase [Pseudomonadota bacterium]